MHIAFVGIPLSGHLNPTLPVVRELVARGHRVTYPTTARHVDAVKATGAFPPIIETSLVNEAPDREQWMTLMRIAMVDETENVLPQLLSFFEGDIPDLVVHDRAAFSGRMLAAILGKRTVQVVPNFAANAHWAVTQRFAPVDTSTPEHALYQSRLKALLGKHDVAWEALPAPACQVIFLPKAIQYEADTFGPTVHFVGPCLRPLEGSWQPPVSGRPVLLISMGTIHMGSASFYHNCLEAFGGSDWHVVMATRDALTFTDVPPNFEIMPYVPQLDVLAHASAMLSHAGIGSVLEALHFGVPLVQLPFTPEQDATAFRVASLNLGVTLTSVEPSALRAAVERVASDPTIAAQVRWMQSEIRSCGGARLAADVIESVV